MAYYYIGIKSISKTSATPLSLRKDGVDGYVLLQHKGVGSGYSVYQFNTANFPSNWGTFSESWLTSGLLYLSTYPANGNPRWNTKAGYNGTSYAIWTYKTRGTAADYDNAYLFDGPIYGNNKTWDTWSTDSPGAGIDWYYYNTKNTIPSTAYITIDIFDDPHNYFNTGIYLVRNTSPYGYNAGFAYSNNTWYNNNSCYIFGNTTYGGTVNVPGSGYDIANEKVFVFHRDSYLQKNLRLLYTGSGSSNLFAGAYYGDVYVERALEFSNTWAELGTTTADYYAITVDQPGTWEETTKQLTAGKTYEFTLHTESESSWDGIIITTSSASSFSGTITNYVDSSNIILRDSDNNKAGYLSGSNGHKTFRYTASANQTIYIYFRADGSGWTRYYDDGTESTKYWTCTSCTNDYAGNTPPSICPECGAEDSYVFSYEDEVVPTGISYGDVSIKEIQAYVISFDKNGGTGGTNSITVMEGTSMEDMPAISIPTRGNFEFYSYSTERDQGVGYYYVGHGYSDSGEWAQTVRNSMWLYAIWYNTVIYNKNSSTFIVYTTTDASTSSTVVGNRTISVSTAGWSSASGGSITMIYHSRPSQYWSMSSDGKTLTVPAGTSPGSYTVRVYLYSDDNPMPANGYIGGQMSVTIQVNVIATAVDTEEEEPWSFQFTPTSCFPAGTFSLTESNIMNYYSITGTRHIYYNNGASITETKPLSQISYGNIVWSGLPVSFSSLGTTCQAQTNVTFSTVSMGVEDEMEDVLGDGSVSSGCRAANSATLTLTKGADPITVGGTTSLTVKATFTSGSVINDASGSCTYTTNPTNKISIS